MRRPTNPQTDPNSLLNRKTGSTARYTLTRLGRNPAARVAELERQNRILRRVLSLSLKVPLGFALKDDRHEVNFDPLTQRVRLYSSDDTVDVERNPAKQWDSVDFRVANPGCTEVVKTIKDTAGTEQSATNCSGSLWFRDGNGYICLIHTGSPPDMELMMYWCAPENAGPEEQEPGFMFPAPATWAIIQVGDECTGQCDEYVVPLWNKPGGA